MAAQLRLRITLDGREPFVVGTRLVDHNLWDITRARHKWAPATDGPVTWMGFLAWAAAKRTGEIDGMTWETFLNECEAVENADNDDDDDGEVGATVDPIRPVPGRGSSAKSPSPRT